MKTGTWNHRVIARTANGERYLNIHEVYYDQPEGKIRNWTLDPVTVGGDTVEELTETLNRMLRAVSKPVLLEVGETLIEEN